MSVEHCGDASSVTVPRPLQLVVRRRRAHGRLRTAPAAIDGSRREPQRRVAAPCGSERMGHPGSGPNCPCTRGRQAALPADAATQPLAPDRPGHLAAGPWKWRGRPSPLRGEDQSDGFVQRTRARALAIPSRPRERRPAAWRCWKSWCAKAREARVRDRAARPRALDGCASRAGECQSSSAHRIVTRPSNTSDSLRGSDPVTDAEPSASAASGRSTAPVSLILQSARCPDSRPFIARG